MRAEGSPRIRNPVMGDLTFGETAQLERHLLELGQSVLDQDVDTFLRSHSEWLRNLAGEVRSQVGGDTLVLLAELVRNNEDVHAKQLAMGGLLKVWRDVERYPDRARFAARFALQRAQELAGHTPMWTGVELSPEDDAAARELFEAARADRSFTDPELITAAHDFIDLHGETAGMFGRLASDLETLVEIVRDQARPDHLETARAALTYFAVVADAVPDDLGLVGLLDDMVVVQRAVADIRPERAALTGCLNRVVSRWPFVTELSLGVVDGEYPVSEFLALNSALLLEDVLADGMQRVALVVPTAGPLPLLCGFMRALAEARELVCSDAAVTYQAGERLVDRVDGAEIVFEGYRAASGTSLDVADRDNATHFVFSGVSGQRRYQRTSPISWLARFRRSARKAGSLKRGRTRHVRFADQDMRLGPLERLFGATEPRPLPAQRRRVVVVTRPLRTAREALGKLTLLGTPLIDVLPMTEARLVDDSIEEQACSKSGPGGIAMLTLVRNAAVALEIVERDPKAVAAVVVGIRPESTDALNTVSIARAGVPILAIVEDGDADTRELLAEQAFGFWAWHSAWFSALHWPTHVPEGHAVAEFECQMRSVAGTRVHVVPVDLDELETAFELLADVEQDARDSEDELFQTFVASGFTLLKILRGIVTHLGKPSARLLDTRFAHLDAQLERGAHWWNDARIDKARAARDGLMAARGRLEKSNPKAAALAEWRQAHPLGVIACRRAVGELMRDELGDATPSWVAARPLKRPPDVCIPTWDGAERMDRLLWPPVGDDVKLLLYGMERRWYEDSRLRRQRLRARLAALAATRETFKGLRLEPPPPAEPELREALLDEDVVIARARRASVERVIGGNSGEKTEARLVHFAGGYWAAFTPERRIHTVTHLLDQDRATGERLEEVPASQLRAGDLAVLLRGSDSDAIREIVDGMAGSDLRHKAACWQRAVRRFAEEHCLDELVAKLAEAGCARHRFTVRQWLEEDRIRPRHSGSDIEAILAATGDPELAACLEDCIDAANELFARHSQVGRDLAAEVFAEARGWLEAGVAPDELVDVNDRVVLVTVESVDPDPVDVPLGTANRLQDGPWQD